jgi:hypothetical protein
VGLRAFLDQWVTPGAITWGLQSKEPDP